MNDLFWRQFSALFWKNWIVLLRHPILNIVRCFVLPVGYGVFLSVAQNFMTHPNIYGIGTSVPITELQTAFDAKTTFLWVDNTTGTASPSPDDIISRMTNNFTQTQLSAVKQLDTPSDLVASCPPNFQGISTCFASVIFHDLPSSGPINYTIRADAGVAHIDVTHHQSDFELRILPLQFAIDRAIIELKTGETIQTPIQWPFTQKTNAYQDKEYRLKYIRGIRKLIVLALFVGYVGVAYQLPGAMASERAQLVTSHMKTMGLLDSARVISWHISHSLAYLPAWIVVAVIWKIRIFTGTNVGIIILVHVLFGLVLASWTFCIATPFGKTPQLAAVTCTLLAVLVSILTLLFTGATDNIVATFIFTLAFPPAFYVFAIRSICGYENMEIPTDLVKGDPENHVMLLPLVIAALINIILWPWLSVFLERHLYDAHDPKMPRRWFSKRRRPVAQPMKPGIAISIKNLGKTFTTSILRGKRKVVTAVEDLTFDIPKYGIFVLLGSNGAGKSTTLSILGGLQGRTRGSVLFEGGRERPAPGTMGIVPQKNVLFPELTCLQTLQVWQAVKHSTNSERDEDLVQLLKDCDLGHKVHYNAAALSGGQKRKLQLAIGLVGGSKIVLVDECTSGVDPLSRRAIWRTLTSVREERTIIFTTHFLDEADLLADNIAILAAPGRLVAAGSPVSLKRDLGEGYTVQCSLVMSPYEEKDSGSLFQEVLESIREVSPQAYLSRDGSLHSLFHLQTKDPATVQKILWILDEYVRDRKIQTYDILGTTLEDIFLDLMNGVKQLSGTDFGDNNKSRQSLLSLSRWKSTDTLVDSLSPPPLELSRGKLVSPFQQAVTIFVKRRLIARRSWLTPLLCIVVAIAGTTFPLVFLSDSDATCVRTDTTSPSSSTSFPLYMPLSPVMGNDLKGEAQVMNYPPNLIRSLGNTTAALNIADVVDNKTFTSTITNNYINTEYGGISMDLDTGASMLAWEAISPGFKGPVMLNTITNILYNDATKKKTGVTLPGAMIQANYDPFPGKLDGTMPALKWSVFFGATMAVYPAFFALYVAQERSSAVQAMQFSNGLSDPIGLWLGHITFDGIFSIVAATVIAVVFATAGSDQFHGVAFLWLVLVLYGIAATLFSYCVSLIIDSPLGAFAASAGYQIVMFLCYFAAYLFTFTYAKIAKEDTIITIIHFTLSILSPIASVERAAFVSINLFSLMCVDNEPVPVIDTGNIMRYGGPITYLIIQILVFLIVLIRPQTFRWRKSSKADAVPAADIEMLLAGGGKTDVAAEAQHAAQSDDLLRVVGVSKTYGTNKVVDDVSLSADGDTIFALLGPNGAGKTTTFNMIRGDVVPDRGDVIIAGHSILKSARKARFALGVCPQFTAIDTQLTVKEHLIIYGRLKGLGHDTVLHSNIQSLLAATTLLPYADRLASKLSGGNQRKLSLAIALMGNPSVILIDEFSTGVDAKMKRDMWVTLRNVAVGKAVVITTHSMEEASALANKVAILAKRVLAVGTMESMTSRYATYEVHFTCRTREETIQTQILMSQIPGSRMADDVATRFEVPIGADFTLSQLFAILSSSQNSSQFAVEKASLESIFLKVIKENEIAEEDRAAVQSWGV